MLDTIKVGIPLTPLQHKKLCYIASLNDKWQWVKYQASTQLVQFSRVRGLLELDQVSYHREIRWDIPEVYHPDDTYLTLEFSVPKYWYGHNIHLLYDYVKALKEVRKLLQKQLHCRFPDVLEWQVFRVDACYTWKFPYQDIAQKYLDCLKRLHFPRKRQLVYETGILFAGRTYSFKIYLKLPEFKNHDVPELLKEKRSLEQINHWETKATGVLRCEATLRRKYLKRQGIKVVADLIKTEFFVHFPDFEDIKFGDDDVEEALDNLLRATQERLPETDVIEIVGHQFTYSGQGIALEKKTILTSQLQKLLYKFIGENKGMETVDKVRVKLLAKYKPNKAARLLAFWLFVQRFGTKEAKEAFGKNPYYVAKADLKVAGVGLVEPPKVIDASQRFIDQFRMEIPSEFVTNKVDDERDSDNLLNLPFQREEHPESDVG